MFDYKKQLNKNELTRIANDYTDEQLKQFEVKLIELESDFENTENIDYAFFDKYFPYSKDCDENGEELENPIPQPIFNPLLYLFLEGKNACFSSIDDQNVAMIESVEIPDWIIFRFLNFVPRDEFMPFLISTMITEGKYSDKEMAYQIANILVSENTFEDGIDEEQVGLVQKFSELDVLDDEAREGIETWLENNEG